MTTPTTPSSPTSPRTLLATFIGADRPGVSKAVLASVADTPAQVLDAEQTVVRGLLTLALLLVEPEATDERSARAAGADLSGRLTSVGYQLGMDVSITQGEGDNLPRRAGRVAVVLVGKPVWTHALSAVASVIADQDANIDRIRRLSRRPVTTIELDVSGAEIDSLRAELGALARTEGLDIAVAPGGLARSGRLLVVMDVDSTLIQDEVIELLADAAGTREEVAAVTEAAMRGELDFADSLTARVAMLRGLPESVFEDVRTRLRLTPGARTLVRTLKRLGHSVGVVSGGFIEVVGPLAEELGLDHVHANRLEVVDGVLTGRVTGDIVDRKGKAAALVRFAELENLPLERTVAIGDGANDLDMLATAGLGVAFNAKPLVRQRADTSVSVPYLDTVLFLLGIHGDDIAEADSGDAGSGGADSGDADSGDAAHV